MVAVLPGVSLQRSVARRQATKGNKTDSIRRGG